MALGSACGLLVTQLTIALGHDSMPLSALFDVMNARPESSGIEQWALRQTTMDEVFLRIARESEEEKLT